MVSQEQKGMSAREKILARIKSNQPNVAAGEELALTPISFSDPIEKFKETLASIGGASLEIEHENQIPDKLLSILPGKKISRHVGPDDHAKADPHAYSDTDVAILRGEFGVAESGAIWITDKQMVDRALPFICSHLVLVIRKSQIIGTLHDAYEKIGHAGYELGTFIAGPSKTADIEQSLVLGAHGAKTMTCFIIR
ncbi:MAG TPA: LUD domain-containing protein [Chryseosolibacter sp.]